MPRPVRLVPPAAQRRGAPRLVAAAVLLWVPMTMACGSSRTNQPAAKAAGTGAGTAPAGAAVKGPGVGLAALGLGPYLAQDLASAQVGAHQLSVEVGYIDMRQTRSAAAQDIFDYRFEEVGVLAADGSLPVKAAPGCAAAAAPRGLAAAAKSLDVTGPQAATLPLDAGGAASVATRDPAAPFVVGAVLAGQLRDGAGAVVAAVAGPKPPTTGAVQLSGAFDANLTVNTSIGDANRNLAQATGDLTIADVGTAKDYNLLVVTFYGGSAAGAPVVRCLVPPGGTATLKAAAYKSLLPLRGITGHFANVVVSTAGGWTEWTAAIVGQGAEDLSVP